MKITEEKLHLLPEKEQTIISMLLIDLDWINSMLISKNRRQLFIDWQDYHDEYSCERTDPCPDYYGCYTLRFEELPNEIIGIKYNVDELDSSIYLISKLLENVEKIH